MSQIEGQLVSIEMTTSPKGKKLGLPAPIRITLDTALVNFRPKDTDNISVLRAGKDCIISIPGHTSPVTPEGLFDWWFQEDEESTHYIKAKINLSYEASILEVVRH